ncbi:MAG TPA: hypothetical protein PLD51_02655 [Pontiellaceae bacterium]|nr:hypothetical protein [Pontiellaceae bacterium]
MAHDDTDKVVLKQTWRLYLTAGLAIAIFCTATWISKALGVEILKAGITGLVFAAVAYCFTRYKNWEIEKMLQKSLTPNGISNLLVEGETKSQAFGVTITNNTGRTVVVRDVEFFTDFTRKTLSPNLLGKYPHVIQPNYRKDKTTTCTVSDKAIQEFLELPPYTEATWGLILGPHSHFLDEEIHGCSVLFEYPRLFGDVMLVRVQSPNVVSDAMRSCWDSVRKKLRHPDDSESDQSHISGSSVNQRLHSIAGSARSE